MKNSAKNHDVTFPPLSVDQWIKTRGYIIAQPSHGESFTIHRGLFEAWADRMEKRIITWPDKFVESTGEVGRQQSWDEYYKSEYVNMDLAEYLTCASACEKVFETIYSIVKPAAL
jgi:hypothetical protein